VYILLSRTKLQPYLKLTNLIAIKTKDLQVKEYDKKELIKINSSQ
jgi:hypothetical protein